MSPAFRRTYRDVHPCPLRRLAVHGCLYLRGRVRHRAWLSALRDRTMCARGVGPLREFADFRDARAELPEPRVDLAAVFGERARDDVDFADVKGQAHAKRALEVAAAVFFQPEDGIRDLTVTGVQTCALPISFVQPLPEEDEGPVAPERVERAWGAARQRIARLIATAPEGERLHEGALLVIAGRPNAGKRSEERRVGEEWRSRWSPDH